MNRLKVNLFVCVVAAVLIPLLTTAVAQAQPAPWTVVKSPNPSSITNLLNGAAADKSSGQAWAVGDFTNASQHLQTLTEFNP